MCRMLLQHVSHGCNLQYVLHSFDIVVPSHALVPLTYLVGDSPNHALPQQYVAHALRTG